MMANQLASSIVSLSNDLVAAIEKRKKELLSEAEELTSENASVHMDVDSSLKTLCSTFGTFSPSDIHPDKCSVTGGGAKAAVVDEAAYIEIHLKDSQGSSCHGDITASVQLESTVTSSTKTTGEKVKWGGDSVTYRYTPLKPGNHLLHVKVFNKHVSNSPFTIPVSMPLKLRFVPHVALEGVAKKLGGVAIGPTGKIAVVDTGGANWKTVLVYNSELELMMSFGDWGSGEGQCYYPVGVAFDLEGKILVTDTYNHRIHKYDRDGSLIKTVGGKGRDPLQFSRPTGIRVSEAGLVYVCDRDNNRIQILTSELEHYKSFGETGDANDNLIFPWDLAFDSGGYVYVVDAGHACIKKFTSSGEYQGRIGPVMKDNEVLKSPQMICIDEYDYIFVTEYLRHEVVVYDTKGVYHTSFGCYGGSKGQFYQPRGIAKTRDGTLYVTDPGNGRLQIFR